VQIANNPYARPEEPAPGGSRPRLDTGKLGIDVVAYATAQELREVIARASGREPGKAKAYSSWTGQRVTVRSREGTVRAGVDGDSVQFPSPLEISIRPSALRIRVPKDRPGPKTARPTFNRRIVARLWSILLERETS